MSLALHKLPTSIEIVEHCEQGYGRVCETLLPDVVAPEAHQNDHSYVCELSGPTFDSLCKNLAWWAVTYTEDLTELKIGGWALVQGWALARGHYYKYNKTNIALLLCWISGLLLYPRNGNIPRIVIKLDIQHSITQYWLSILQRMG